MMNFHSKNIGRAILFATILQFSNLGFAADSANEKTADVQLLTQLLAEHEVRSTQIYCRTDVVVPECRFLMRLKNKATQKPVQPFLIAFSAPARPQSGNEAFLPNQANEYKRIVYTKDATTNSLVVKEVATQIVHDSNQELLIKDIKFGKMTADLSFSLTESRLKGVEAIPSAQDPSLTKPVLLIYKEFQEKK